MDEAAERRAQRGARAAEHADAEARRRARESAKAQELLDDFVAAAERAGLATEELRARPWSGNGSYRTGVTGWYLRRDHTVGVGEDGSFYVLLVRPARFGRWRQVPVDPSPPPLVVGEGGRDGDAVALDDLLRTRLEW